MTTTLHASSSKKIGEQNVIGSKKNANHRAMTISIKPVNENNEFIGIGNYNNIYINSRMTNSFGDLKEEKLAEFYEFEDDFD